MSLHKATELIKKLGIGMGIGISLIVVITIFVKIGGFIISTTVPEKITPPNQAYDLLPIIQFPPNKVDNNFTYVLDTKSGTLPTDFPDRLAVFTIFKPEANFLNLDKAKVKAQSLGFSDQQGKALPETSLGDGIYEWVNNSVINKKLTMNTVTFNFSLASNYLATLSVLGAQNLSNEQGAIEAAKSLLDTIQLFPEDIDLEKIKTPQEESTYDIYPKIYSIRSGALVPATSLSTAQVIRVDFHQKDIEYELETGRKSSPKTKIKLPIRYPDPPNSTMSFWIGSGESRNEVFAANYFYNKIELLPEITATYPLKSVTEGFDELKNGKAYIAAYSGLDQQILISNVYLAYYSSDQEQAYLMPVIVFEGQDGFLAYVSAVKNEATK